MLLLQILPHNLLRKIVRSSHKHTLDSTYSERPSVRLGTKRVVILESLVLHVDRSAYPMHIVLIDREDDDILGENVDLQKRSVERSQTTMAWLTFFVHLPILLFS